MTTILYLGTEEGVLTLRSSGNGSWDAEQALTDWEVEEVVPVAGEPGNVLAGTRGDGVWLSRDYGKTWKKPSYGKRGPGKVRCLALDPNRPGRIYAGCEPIDIYVSDDLGANWERLDSVWDVPSVASIEYPVPGVEPHVRDITIDPSDPDTIYAALQVGYMIKSTDGGKSWRLIDGDVDADIHTIVIDPTHASTVIVATGGHDSRSGRVKGRALYRSEDGGDHWTPVGLEFSQEYSVPLVMSPSNPKVVFSSLAHGTPGAWRRPTGPEAVIVRTADGGTSWQPVGNGLSEMSGFFAGAIAFDEAEPDRVYAALNTGDVLTSPDGGDSWTRLNIKAPKVSDMKCVRAQ